MLKSVKTANPLYKLFYNTFVDLPAPPNLSFFWNMGSLLFLCIIVQMMSGILLASVYSVTSESFNSLMNLMETTDKAWLLRFTHSNGASMFFMCIFIHTGRNIYYNSFTETLVWQVGVTMMLVLMATSFLGYVLPLNQMSFWGASVITNLFSEVPYIGPDLVKIIWGGPAVNTPTINRFFAFHFALPFMILLLALIHIMALHARGSNNPLGLMSHLDKVSFHNYYSMKDFLGMTLTLMLLFLLVFYYPVQLGDNENFVKANFSATPDHIQPEWYFLFAYAILRSIPNKLGGVIALSLSVLILYTLPHFNNPNTKTLMFSPALKTLFWCFVFNLILLTWIGARSVEEPYIFMSQILSALYFAYFMILPMIMAIYKCMCSCI